MATWSEWFPDMLAQLPGCPSFTVEHELRNAAIQFFEESRAWKTFLEPLAVSAGTAEVELESDSPNQETIVRLESAWYDGQPLDVITADEMDAQCGQDWTVLTGTPKAIIQLMTGIVRLYPVPLAASTSGFKARVSLRPSDTATQIPKQLMKYRHAIKQGAMARLQAYPNQPWSAIDLAMKNEIDFKAAIARALIDASRSFGRGRIASRPTWC